MSVRTIPRGSEIKLIQDDTSRIHIFIPHTSELKELEVCGETKEVTVFSKIELYQLTISHGVKTIYLFGAKIEKVNIPEKCVISENSTMVPKLIVRNSPIEVKKEVSSPGVFSWPEIEDPLVIDSKGVLVVPKVPKTITELFISNSLLKTVDLNGTSLNVIEIKADCIGKITFCNGKVNRVIRYSPHTKIIESDDCQITTTDLVNKI